MRYTEPIFDEKTKTWRSLTAKDIEAGAVQLLAALRGTYVDMSGKPKPVKGDISKLPYVRNLQPAARKLLQNMRVVGKALPGTQEARRRMRFEIEALRIKFGVPLFVTFSPDEAHQLLYVRLSRTRRSDPVRRAPAWEEWISGDREFLTPRRRRHYGRPYREFAKSLAIMGAAPFHLGSVIPWRRSMVSTPLSV